MPLFDANKKQLIEINIFLIRPQPGPSGGLHCRIGQPETPSSSSLLLSNLELSDTKVYEP